MKIILMEGFGSSGFFQPPYKDYMGGPENRARIEEADVVIATWPPEDRPVILKCPDDVEVTGAVWHWSPEAGRKPTFVPSVTAQEMHDDIIESAEEHRRDW